MKEIKLSQHGKNKLLNLVALVDDADFERLNQWKWYAHKGIGKKTFYALRTAEGSKGVIRMHREILGLAQHQLADHKDRNGLNNQRENLRICTASQNNMNIIRSTDPKKTSKYKGVTKSGERFATVIYVNHKRVYRRVFDSETDAALDFNRQSLIIHGEFAALNILP